MLRGLARLETALNTRSAAPTDRALAAELGVSERRLRTIFQTTLGVTPRQWLSARRAELLREQLAKGVDVLPAVYDAGYDSASAAYEAAEGELGMPLGRYRKRGAGERIGWTIVPIPDGVALVAATRRGLCAVRLGDDASDLEHELRTEFAAAELVRDDGGLVAAAAIVTELANGRVASTALSLPLDVVGTAFKRRVWRALRDIPPGETRSYGEVAKAVGSPAAVRAVASACATNPVALVVPCHRVIGADGALRGYRWGIQRKQRLLRLEAESVAARDQRAAV